MIAPALASDGVKGGVSGEPSRVPASGSAYWENLIDQGNTNDIGELFGDACHSNNETCIDSP